jgi:hypothetical protein
MLDAVQKRCPALTKMFNMFYALDSMCFFRVNGKMEIIWSTEGSRMGCVMGSFGFDLTVQDIYEAILARFPSVVIKALTDDLTLGIPPPTSPDTTQKVWEECADILETIAEESKAKAGLELNFSKCHALAPSNIVDPVPNTLPEGTTLERKGVRLAGAPIGTDEFCVKYMDAQVRDIIRKMDALDGIDPQTGFALLQRGIVPTLVYFSQVTPPQISLPALKKYDAHVLQCAMGLLTPAGSAEALECSDTRMQRAMDKMQLPLRYGGCGLTRAARIGPIAYYASVASSHPTDPDLTRHKAGLTRFCEKTHALVLDRIGPKSKESLNIETIFPRSQPYAHIDDSFYVEIYETKTTLKLQKVLSMCAHAVAARELKVSCSKVTNDVCKSDIIATHTRSLSVCLLRAPLSDPANRMTALEFVTWIRFFLSIPQLARLGNARYSDQLGYHAEECLHTHFSGPRRLLDIHANHANSGCPSAAAGLHTRHSLFKWAVFYLAKEAGCSVVMEPQTANLLLKQFSAVQCRALFPAKPSKLVQKEVRQLQENLKAIETMAPGHERTVKLNVLNGQCRMLYERHKTKGLRVDVQITDPHSGEERWVDTTCIHPTCKTRIKMEFKYINQ